MKLGDAGGSVFLRRKNRFANSLSWANRRAGLPQIAEAALYQRPLQNNAPSLTKNPLIFPIFFGGSLTLEKKTSSI